MLFTIERTDLLKKFYSLISEKHDQTSIQFSNYIGFHEFKSLCAFKKYTAQTESHNLHQMS